MRSMTGRLHGDGRAEKFRAPCDDAAATVSYLPRDHQPLDGVLEERTTVTTPSTSSPTGGSAVASKPSVGSSSGTEVANAQGKTSISDVVVAKIAGLAVREVSGVYRLGGGAARAFGAIRERIPGSGGPNVSQGVAVEVGETQAAVDVDVVVEYGVSITDLAAGIRRNVITSIERMTGLEVVEVNISVDDVHLPTDDAEGEQPSRVA